MYKTRTESQYVNLTVPVPVETWTDPHALAAYLEMIAYDISRKNAA